MQPRKMPVEVGKTLPVANIPTKINAEYTFFPAWVYFVSAKPLKLMPRLTASVAARGTSRTTQKPVTLRGCFSPVPLPPQVVSELSVADRARVQ